MDAFILLARGLLVLVFVTAGVAKLLDLQGSRQALEGFGVPRRLVPGAAILLPLAELATAVALVFPASARWGGVAALLLLLAFIAGIAHALSQGQAPDCHCFGQLHSAPAGRETLVRNAALAVLAGTVVIWGPGPAVDTWIADRIGAELAAGALAVIAALLASVAFQLWRDNRSLRGELEDAQEELALFPAGLPVGAMAPSFSLPTAHGGTLSLEALCARGQPVLLIFAHPKCGPCWMMLPHVRHWQQTITDRLTVALISSGTPEGNRDVVEDQGIVDVLLQDDHEVMDRYRMEVTPSAVVVSPDGRIASATVVGSRPVEPLVRWTLQEDIGAAGVKPAAAPQLAS
jgi:peroxiredoxin/uncharacterized membrane protein YphA (DoxX/SURF4 family)